DGAGTLAGRGIDVDQVRAQRLDLPGHLDRGAVAHRDQQDHGGDADQDAEHGQARPEPVGAQAGERERERFEQLHALTSTRWDWCSSSTTRPSLRRMTRLEKAAMSVSCVIRTIVRPWSFSSTSSLRISALASLSRL